MADLNVTIGADISAYQQGMQQASAIAKGTTDNLNTVAAAVGNQQKSIEQLTIKLASYQQIVYKATDPAVIVEYNGKIAQLNAEIGQMEQLGKQGFGALGSGAQSASMKFMQMRSGISAARDGVMAFTLGGQAAERSLMAMGHHINSLVNETGSFKGALGALAGSLWGPGGIILALTLAAELFSKWRESQKKAAETQDEFTKSLNDGVDSASKEVSHLMILYQATQNDNLSRQQRLVAVKELQKEYPAYFGNLSQEAILAGQAAGAYDRLTQSLINSAVVKAGQESLAESLKPLIQIQAALQAQQYKLDKAYEAAKAKRDAASSQQTKPTAPDITGFRQADISKQQHPVIGGNFVLDDKKDLHTLDEYKNDIQDKIKSNAAAIQGLLEQYGVNALLDKASVTDKKAKAAKDGFAIIEEEISKLKLKLEDAVMSGQKPTILADLSGQITALETKLDALKEKYLLAFYPHMNDVLPTGNTTTQNSIQAINEPLKNVPTGNDIEASVKAYQKQHDAIWQSYLATKQYNAENKLENQTLKELTNTIGRGLTHAFESALNGTQSFVSAMGQFLLQLIEKLIAAAAAAAILAILLSATGFGAVGSFGSIFGSLSGLSGLVTGQASGGGSPGHYAEGGIFNRATVGMFGEAGKEAIVTPEHLADFAGIQQQRHEPMQLSMKLQGSDMLLFLNRATKTKGRTS